MIVANVWKGTAWSYLLFTAALDSVSREVVEAAQVDGATRMQRIWLVILPIIRPHIATNMLFITIWTFTYFPLIYAMTGGGPGRQTEVLSVFMYHQAFRRRETRLRQRHCGGHDADRGRAVDLLPPPVAGAQVMERSRSLPRPRAIALTLCRRDLGQSVLVAVHHRH